MKAAVKQKKSIYLYEEHSENMKCSEHVQNKSVKGVK